MRVIVSLIMSMLFLLYLMYPFVMIYDRTLDEVLFWSVVGTVFGCAIFVVTPPGQALLRFTLGFRQPIGSESQRLQPLLDGLSDKVTELSGRDLKPVLYMVDDPAPNAMAVGGHSVGVTRGLLDTFDDAEIQGILAHELGHLYYRDSRQGAAMYGAFWPTLLVHRLLSFILPMIAPTSLFSLLLIGMFYLLLLGILWGIIIILWLWNLVINLLSRRQEYRADAFAAELGLRDEMIRGLEKLSVMDYGKKGLIARLQDAHPNIMSRIGRLERVNG